MENPEISPCTYRQLIYDKGGNAGETVPSTNGSEKMGRPHVNN